MLYALVGGGSSTSNLIELLELHPHRESKGSIDFFHMSSDSTDTTPSCVVGGVVEVKSRSSSMSNLVGTTSGKFEHIEPHQTYACRFARLELPH